MKRYIIIHFVLLFAFLVGIPGYTQSQGNAVLTDMEKAYIQEKGPIKLVVDPDWYPYEQIDKSGVYRGIASELVDIILQRTGIKAEIITTSDWKESLDRAKSGEADLVSFLNKTEERSKWLLFTEPYFIDPNVLITREEHDYIPDISRYIDERMVLPEGTSIEERLRKDYPKLEIIIVKNEDEAVDYVERKKADFTLRSLTMAAYVIKNEGHFNLKIAGEIPGYKNQLRMGITKQDKMLQEILNKGIATISEQDVQDAINKHISIKIVNGFDYRLFFVVFGVFSVILITTLYWLRRIQGLNKKLEQRREELISTTDKLASSERQYRMIAEELESKNNLLLELATTDVLTGLKNRLYFNQRANEEIEKFKRYGTKLSLLIIDIDHFKRINDTYGHGAGDEVLKQLSNGLQQIIRNADLLARWGGEEFIVLLPCIDLEEAANVAEKLRREAESIIHGCNEVITISIGVSTLFEADTLETWINRTDKALYHAKKQGRNRYCIGCGDLESQHIEIIQWDPAWNSGHGGIDQQHMELLTMCNALMNRVLCNDKEWEILPLLTDVIKSVQKHFDFEEEVLQQIEYTEVAVHKTQHNELLTKAKMLLNRSENGYLLPIDVAHFVVDDVMIKHLLQEDTKFFDLLKRSTV